MPVHHLILDEYIVAAGLPEWATSVPEPQFAWNSRDRTSAKPVQRLGCDSEAGQGGGFSHPGRMSHLAGNRYYHLPGERRTARARPADGWT
jgi:hypothetical protein